MGRYIVNVEKFGRGPNVAASYFEWSVVEKRPDLSDGGLHLPQVDCGLIRFAQDDQDDLLWNFLPVRQ